MPRSVQRVVDEIEALVGELKSIIEELQDNLSQAIGDKEDAENLIDQHFEAEKKALTRVKELESKLETKEVQINHLLKQKTDE